MNAILPIKGWICLDIDGTLTDNIKTIPSEVLDLLTELDQKHWKIVFVTGRLFAMAHEPLKGLKFPYYLAVQNGASWYEMPQKIRRSKKYLPLSSFIEMESLFKGTTLDFVLVSGTEEGDLCFYRPDYLSPKMADYFKNDLSTYGGNWRAVSSFELIDIKEFPYGKVYGPKSDLQKLQLQFDQISTVKTHLIQDSVNPNNQILQVMRADVDKGKTVLDIIASSVLPTPIIAAGNDLNDETLLSIADVKIAMANSPKPLLEMADFIAPPVEEMGIIPALKRALIEVESK